MFSLLIKDTTRAQREEIVRRSLNACGGRIDAIYQPYIDGEKELADINAEYAASRKLIR